MCCTEIINKMCRLTSTYSIPPLLEWPQMYPNSININLWHPSLSNFMPIHTGASTSIILSKRWVFIIYSVGSKSKIQPFIIVSNVIMMVNIFWWKRACHVKEGQPVSTIKFPFYFYSYITTWPTSGSCYIPYYSRVEMFNSGKQPCERIIV